MSPRRRAILYMVAFATLWPLVEVLAGTLRLGYSPYQVVFTRYLVHIALMAAVWGFRDPLSLVRTRRPIFQLARSLLMLGMPASYVLALTRGVPGSTLLSIFWLSPFVMLGLAVVFLRERASLAAWCSALVSYVGIRLFVGVAPLPDLLSLVFAVGIGLTLAVYVVMTRSLRTECTRANLFYTAFGVAAALLPVMPRLWMSPPPLDLAKMIGVGVLGFFTLYAVDRATALSPVPVSAPFVYVQMPTLLFMQRCLGQAHIGVRGLVASSIIVLPGLYLWTREDRGSVSAARV